MGDKRIESLQQEYMNLLHALQSGVKAEMDLTGPMGELDNTAETSPKHLRVGVNSALTQNSGLVKLLIDKGVITELEYWQKQVEGFRAEVHNYEELLSKKLGTKVKLR